jgi:hypothetical protein
MRNCEKALGRLHWPRRLFSSMVINLPRCPVHPPQPDDGLYLFLEEIAGLRSAHASIEGGK